MSTPAVEINGVSKRFGEVLALESLDLSIKEQEFVSLLGASGCGKSTLLRIISGFEEPSTGTVRVHGRDVTSIPPHRRPTNIVFQRGALFPHMSVFENIAYSLELRNWERRQIANKVEEMLALVRLEGMGDRHPSQLSGGQAQRVALARALAAQPQVLLLDEPLSALDLKLREQMQLELRSIQRKLGATFVFVTHDQTEALVMSDRIAIMNHGRIVQFGSPRDIYKNPSSVFAADFIGQTNLLPGTIVAVDGDLATLRLPNQRCMPARTGERLSVGGTGTISVRPEAIKLVHSSKAGLPAEVVELVYIGRVSRVALSVGLEQPIWVELDDADVSGLEVGSTVTIDWAPKSAILWNGERT